MTINPTDAIRSLIRQVDPDPDREGLEETPGRYCAALQEWTSGYHVDTDKLLKTFADGGEKYDEMVFVGSIPFYSMCEHHLATFFGVAHVAYIPSTRIVGLSKIPRLVDAFARRLSVQERITTQVADAMEKNLSPQGVAVCLQARHMCMESRGIRCAGSVTTTAAMRGAFKEKDHAKAEFYRMISNAKGIGLV
jgi:GTP cyclohydrolase I